MQDRDNRVSEQKIKSDDEALKVRTRCIELCELQMTATSYAYERSELADKLCILYEYDNTADSYLWEVLEYIALMHSSNLQNIGLAMAVRYYECWLDRNGKPLEKQLSYCERERFTPYYKDVYPYRLRANILRGENELTGNLIEVSWGANKILVECGQSLNDGDSTNEEILERINNFEYDSIVISHPHLDHNGLISKISKKIPIYMGAKSIGLYKIKNRLKDTSNLRAYRDGVRQELNGFFYPSITPILCDHSTFDSYMLLIESDKEKILYSGDFRGTGNKSFQKLLNHLPKEVALLICEGTNIHSHVKPQTEKELRQKMEDIMGNDGPVFVLTSSQNIDRVVSVYKASVKTNRGLYVNLYQAKVLEIVGENVPNPRTFDRVKVVYPHGISKQDMSKYIYYKDKSVSVTELAQNSNFTMLITVNDIHYLLKMKEYNENVFQKSTLIYSLWAGYKEREDMKDFLGKVKELGIKENVIHTSGHADKKTIDRLISMTNPRDIKFVHVR